MYELFRERLAPIVEMCSIHKKRLVLRDHSHSDYLTDRAPGKRLVDALLGRYALRRVVTIRNPIDAWLSMVENGFAAQLAGFEQYCERHLRFLDDYADVPVWRYKDFVMNPDDVIRALCVELDIPFLAGFAERASGVVLTDSGRRPRAITSLPRRAAAANFLEGAAKLPAYRQISERFNYDGAA